MSGASTSEANKVRGEITLALAGQDYVLRPSYKAILAIEAKTGKGLLALFRSSAEGNLTLGDAGIVATECIRADGAAKGDKMLASFDAERVTELIMESDEGPVGVLATLSVLLGMAVCGDYTASGEVKAAKDATAATA